MIKAIIFDCFGVLTKDLWLAYCDTVSDKVALERAHELNHQYDKGLITQQEFIDQVAKATGRTPKEIGHIFTSEVAKNDELFAYIAELKQRGYKTGIISNVGTDWISTSFLSPQDHALFDAIILSYELGISKPDPGIYQAAIDQLGVSPEEAVFTDDRQVHIMGAEQLSMHGILYTDFKSFKTSLEQLLDSNN